MSIVINCTGSDTIELHQLTEFQGELKERSAGDIDKIIKSIRKHGFSFPFFVWAHAGENGNYINHVLDGHGRLEALKKLQSEGEEIPALPCVYISAKDEAEAKEKLLKLNSQYGHMTAESVADFLDGMEIELDDLALPDGVLDLSGIAAPEEETEGDDDAPDVDEDGEPDSQPGEMYELGNSILLCGDSTNPEDVARILGGLKADLVFTDPPYGMKKESDGVANDNLNYDDLLEFNKKWLALAFEHLKENGSLYCWGIDEPLMDIYNYILKPKARAGEITFRNLITWDKGNGQGQNSEGFRMYAIADEKCLFIMNGVQGFNTNADNYFEGWEPIRDYLLKSRKAMGWDVPTMKRIVGHSDLSRDHWTGKSQFNLPTREVYDKLKAEAEKQRKERGMENDAFKREYDAFKREYDDIKREYDDIKRAFYDTRAYFNNTWDNMNNVWHFAKTSGAERESAGGHATPKPVALCERAIKSSSRERETVLDFFGGSGSTLIAAEKNNRKALLIELEPKWCDVIRKRWTKWAQENGREVGLGGLE